MSYILDALKRSEQERQVSASPALLDQMGTTNTATRHEKVKWVAALLCVNLVVLGGWWLLQRDEPIAASAPIAGGVDGNATDRNSAAADSGGAYAADATRPRTAETAADNEARVLPANAPATATADARTTSASSNVVTARPANPLTSNSDQRGRAFPNLKVTTHIYSSERTFRTITINGTSLREGDVMNNGVEVVEITTDGALVTLDGSLKRLRVMQDWEL